MLTKAVILGAVAGLLSGPASAADDAATLDALMAIEGDVEWGEYLSGECTACHAASGGRIPPLSGLPREYMLSALHDYKIGYRENATMQNVAEALGDEELAALAAYFESVE
ncbi:Cytochrome subunit of sulfide dehydrogenase [Rhodobacteraceae bacterium THAF1]|uniref:c-type cytochrome n=1 Tax=Palleronia sp. THAF1 TaxID=2587842 RepID=UPI000F3E1C3B|nr:c-type cytochrome [Palleronia sp. THAF1]QFU09058.1 Cytochrome subunit of sulfide dehydrogenase [Palleronia sp. THAF1]VDC24143.1 Cytochrome subunit of sulfide dehydrogenase [Rhodobacteraceae bacterium THAF1]